MRICKSPAARRFGIPAALLFVLLPQCANALSNAPAGPGETQDRLTLGQAYNPAFALAPGLAPWLDTTWTPRAAAMDSFKADAAFNEDSGPLSFDTGGYDAMWDDTKFSEMAAYGGLARDALRVAAMRAIDGSDGASGAIPFGQLTLARDFRDEQHRLAFGAYGTQASVRPTAISGFGDDSYTDVALDGSWRWTAHPERSTSDAVSVRVLLLHEDQDLIASHAIFGTAKNDELTVFRAGASWSWGDAVAPALQYFQVTGTSDPVRLGLLDGSPDSKGWIAGLDFQPPVDERAPFALRLSLEFVAYSEFDGSSRDASQNNAVLLHLSASTDPGQ